MQYLKWYVYRIGGYMYRIKCEPYYTDALYRDRAIDEYRKCGSKDEAVELCSKFNCRLYKKMKRRKKNGN